MNLMLETSAILALLQDEAGADLVEAELESGALCGAANRSEVAQKVPAVDRDWHLARALLFSYELDVEPVVVQDAEWAALRWQRGEGLSLADRLCLALSERVDIDVLTANASWGIAGRIRQIG